MSSPWEFAIPQTMQRHGGSNRSVPKAAQSKVAVSTVALPALETPADRADVASPERPDDPSIVPDHR
jgi:hypothetical protein